MEEKYIDGLLVVRSNLYRNYGCSKCGAVFRWDTEKPMSVWLSGNPRVSEGGKHDKYLVFRTCENNVTGFGFYHKILADCWVPNPDPENRTQVNHRDGDKENCKIDNLEWVTPSQNQRHALEAGLKQRGEDLYNSSLTESQVHQICQALVDGSRPVDIASDFGCSSHVVRKIRTGDCYMHIRQLYPVSHKYRKTFSESTVRWVCDKILLGISDEQISKQSTNKNLVANEVRRIRYKIRYRKISDEYF